MKIRHAVYEDVKKEKVWIFHPNFSFINTLYDRSEGEKLCVHIDLCSIAP